MNPNWIRQLVALLLAALAALSGAQAQPTKEDPKALRAKTEAMFAERC